MYRYTRSLARIAAVLVAQVAFIAGGVFLGGSDAADHSQPVASPAEVRLQAMVDAGTCWGNNGEAHGYPSRVWVRTASGYELRGQATVDAILSTHNYSRVAAFCTERDS